jgi:serine protease Do
MKTFLTKTTLFLAFIASLLFYTTSFATTTVDTSIAPMLKNVLPAIVNIKAQIKITDFNTMREIMKQKRGNSPNSNSNEDTADQKMPTSFTSVGSGVIIDAKNGYIITNSHVVNDAQMIAVTLNDGHHYTAKVIGMDKPSDVAILQIKAKKLTAAVLGDSNNLKVGDFVAAIGNPFGLNQSVTSGIISALGRTTLGIETYENFIQTDAPINPGNSGGALVNMQGQVIGINTAILAPDRGNIGIGFAIPANIAKSVVVQLLEFGDVKRGVLGIGAQDITPDLANAFDLQEHKGSVITQVQFGSPADQAGLQVGDIITAINGTPIKNASDVLNTIGFLRVNSKVNIAVLRNKKSITLNASLSDSKKRKELVEHQDPFLFGVGLKNLNVLSPVHGNVNGVLVVSVEEDSNAWHADLRPGDVITSINQQKVKSIAELKAFSTKSDKIVLLNILRGPSAAFIVISKEES